MLPIRVLLKQSQYNNTFNVSKLVIGRNRILLMDRPEMTSLWNYLADEFRTFIKKGHMIENENIVIVYCVLFCVNDRLFIGSGDGMRAAF